MARKSPSYLRYQTLFVGQPRTCLMRHTHTPTMPFLTFHKRAGVTGGSEISVEQLRTKTGWIEGCCCAAPIMRWRGKETLLLAGCTTSTYSRPNQFPIDTLLFSPQERGYSPPWVPAWRSGSVSQQFGVCLARIEKYVHVYVITRCWLRKLKDISPYSSAYIETKPF